MERNALAAESFSSRGTYFSSTQPRPGHAQKPQKEAYVEPPVYVNDRHAYRYNDHEIDPRSLKALNLTSRATPSRSGSL